MHVLIVSAWDPKSGVLTLHRSLAKHLRPHGVRFSAFGFNGWGAETGWTFCEELIDGRSTTLAEVLMTGKYDLLHCLDGVYSSPYCVEKWARRARFAGPIVLMAQQTDRLLTEPAHATRYVACSQAAADVLALDADGSVSVIPNGYDEDVFRPGAVQDPDRPCLVWVGRTYDPDKGALMFLDAVEKLPEYDAVIVDDDADAHAVKSRLERLGTRVQHCALLSPDDLADVFRTAGASGGAFVSTSRREGFPFVTVEAMACGCPVVAPRIAGHSHLVDGTNAIVYERKNGAEAVIEAIERLSDPAVRRGLIVRAQEESRERWNSCAMASAYLELYNEAIAASPTALPGRITDRAARLAWRAAIAGRPAWRRARRLTRR